MKNTFVTIPDLCVHVYMTACMIIINMTLNVNVVA